MHSVPNKVSRYSIDQPLIIVGVIRAASDYTTSYSNMWTSVLSVLISFVLGGVITDISANLGT
jgi:hypothetical protein